MAGAGPGPGAPPLHAGMQCAGTVVSGHACVLHACDSVAPSALGHAAPPRARGVVTVYARDCVPPPHARLQSDQLPQLPAQSTGATEGEAVGEAVGAHPDG